MTSKADERDKARLVGINHVALEVGNIEEALRFYRQLFSFELRGTHRNDTGEVVMAFIDMGDQFLALSSGRHQSPDVSRHFGLVVDDRSHVEILAKEFGVQTIEGRSFQILDPWGNRLEVVEYSEIQFIKTDGVLRSMHMRLEKSAQAEQAIRDKGMV